MLLAGVVLLIGLTAAGCGSAQETATPTAAPKPVVTTTVAETTTDVTLEYIGIVNMEPTHNLAFKSGGKLLALHVEKGRQVKAGDLLAELDAADLQLQKDAADAQLAAAQAQYAKAAAGAQRQDLNNASLNVDKAQAAYDYAADLLAKLEQLLKDGIVSADDVEQARLGVQVREKELAQAKEVLSKAQDGAQREDLRALSAQVDAAKVNVEARRMLLDDAKMVSDVDGQVIEVMFDPGEMIGEGYPLVIIGTPERIAHVGITADDLTVVKAGMKALASRTGAGSTAAGAAAEPVTLSVSRVSDIPDQTTRTYDVELPLPEDAFPLGATLEIRFLTGKVTGIWIPMSTVLSEGADYVLLERDGFVVRQNIEILETAGTRVRISGLTAGDHLISEGIRRLNEGDAVTTDLADDAAGSSEATAAGGTEATP